MAFVIFFPPFFVFGFDVSFVNFKLWHLIVSFDLIYRTIHMPRH